MKNINVVLFDDFETLDAFGPVEILGKMSNDYQICCLSEAGGIVTSRQGVPVAVQSFEEAKAAEVLLIPGGLGTRSLIKDQAFIQKLEKLCQQSSYVLSVCTGTALLAKTDLLNHRQATSNKLAFDWVRSLNEEIEWVEEARWVVDGKYYTSSGVSAGMDMALGFVVDQFGRSQARKIAFEIEYLWNEDQTEDPFYQKKT